MEFTAWTRDSHPPTRRRRAGDVCHDGLGADPGRCPPPPAAGASAPAGLPADPWPRQIDLSNGTVLMYQPQVSKLEATRPVPLSGAGGHAQGRQAGELRRDVAAILADLGRQGRAQGRVREPQDHERLTRSRSAATASGHRPGAQVRTISLDRLTTSLSRSAAQAADSRGAKYRQILVSFCRRSWCRSTARPVKPCPATATPSVIKHADPGAGCNSGALTCHVYDGWLTASSLGRG